MRLLCLFTLVLSLLTASTVSSQTIWTDDAPRLTEDVVAYAPYRAFYFEPITIRPDQQDLYFSSDGWEFFEMQVCVVTQTVECDPNADAENPPPEWEGIHPAPGVPTTSALRWANVPTEPGPYDVRLRYFKVAGGMEYAQFDMAVVPPASRAFTDDEGNHMMLWPGTTSTLDSPFLVVEGIDADNANSENAYYGLGLELFGIGRERGADVVILDFADGGQDMRQNAEVVKSAIHHLNTIKVGSRPLDVAGVSMGGVVARYALADMEQDGEVHGVGRFVSMDAPHQGAVLDHELLNWMHDPPSWAEGKFDPPRAITRMAGLQLLTDNPFDTSTPSQHQRFYDELEALNGDGYPHATIENVGVSFGTPSPNPHAAVEAEWLEIEVDVYTNPHFYIESGSGEAQPGSYLPRDVTDMGGIVRPIHFLGVPIPTTEGAYNLDRKEDVDPTFIPYASALDIVGGVSRFDLPTLHAAEASHHDRIPPEIIEPLLIRLGYPAPLTASISRPTALNEGDQATWTAHASGGTGTFAYRWYYSVLEDIWIDTGVTTPSYTRTAGSVSFTLKARVTSGTQMAEPTRYVAVTPDGDGGPPCKPNSGPCPSPPELESGDATGASAKASAMASAQATAQVFAAPATFTLEAARPNPFRAATTLRFALPAAAQVRLVVYDVLGRAVARPVDGWMEAGYHEAIFDGTALPAGVFVVRLEASLEAGVEVATQRVTLVR